MKKSIALAIAIIALGAAPALFQQKRLADLRDDQRRLTAQALKLGLAIDPSSIGGDARLTKRQREDIEKHAATAAKDVLAFARELETMQKNGTDKDAAFQSRAADMMARLMELDPSQLKRVIAALRNDEDLSAETRGNLIAFSILTLSEDNPETAITIFTESRDLLDKNQLGEHVISAALTEWAQDDPSAALAWIRKNAAAHPEIADDEARCSVLAGTAASDPKHAFQLIAELGFKDSSEAIHAIMGTGNDDPDHRIELLEALRGHLATITDEEQRDEISGKALELMARTTDHQGYDELTGWIEDAELTQKEKAQFADGLTYFTTKADTGRWVDWLAGSLPADKLADPVKELVGEWTQQDYLAAGKWLSEAADGPAKTSAVEAYAEAVAEYEPQVAAQWAMTLPPGPQREATLRSIYQNWPSSDPQGASKFARDHGLE
jgi:hypothetical protein